MLPLIFLYVGKGCRDRRRRCCCRCEGKCQRCSEGDQETQGRDGYHYSCCRPTRRCISLINIGSHTNYCVVYISIVFSSSSEIYYFPLFLTSRGLGLSSSYNLCTSTGTIGMRTVGSRFKVKVAIGMHRITNQSFVGLKIEQNTIDHL